MDFSTCIDRYLGVITYFATKFCFSFRFQSGGSTCSLCEKGFYSDGRGSVSCTSCPRWSSTDTRGASSREECSCRFGMFGAKKYQSKPNFYYSCVLFITFLPRGIQLMKLIVMVYALFYAEGYSGPRGGPCERWWLSFLFVCTALFSVLVLVWVSIRSFLMKWSPLSLIVKVFLLHSPFFTRTDPFLLYRILRVNVSYIFS